MPFFEAHKTNNIFLDIEKIEKRTDTSVRNNSKITRPQSIVQRTDAFVLNNRPCTVRNAAVRPRVRHRKSGLDNLHRIDRCLAHDTRG